MEKIYVGCKIVEPNNLNVNNKQQACFYFIYLAYYLCLFPRIWGP